MVRARTGARWRALTFECELGYTFDRAVWGQGFASEAARCVRDYARAVLRLSHAISAILPQNTRSRRVAERSGARRPNGRGRSHVGSLRVAARDRRRGSAPADIRDIGVARTGGSAGSPAAPARTRRAPRAPARGPTPAGSEDDTEHAAATGARAPAYHCGSPAAASRNASGRRRRTNSWVKSSKRRR